MRINCDKKYGKKDCVEEVYQALCNFHLEEIRANAFSEGHTEGFDDGKEIGRYEAIEELKKYGKITPSKVRSTPQ